MSVDLRPPQTGQIIVDSILVVQAKMLGVGANKSLVENAAGKLIEVFFFDGAQHAHADLGDVGNVIEREFSLLARFAEFVSEFAHVVCRVVGTS